MLEAEANKKGRERLRAITNRLSEAELAMLTGDGWTVGATLGHLAFWDNRVRDLILRWKESGIGPSPIDTDNINDAMKPLLRAIPGREAVEQALRAAEAVDAEIENLPEELKPGVEALVKEGKLRLDRSIHRNEHLDQIERALADNR
jgi:DinB superfamily